MSTDRYIDAILESLPARTRLPMWWSATSMGAHYWVQGLGAGWKRVHSPDATWAQGYDLTSAIEMACWDVMIADGFTVEERREALGRLDERLRARDEGRICCECGAWDVYVEQGRKRWAEERMTLLAETGCCFDCSHWVTIMRAAAAGKQLIVVSQSWGVYSVGRENTSENGFRGFGGAKQILRFHDGRTLRSSNLWSVGTLPEHFRARLPQNVRIVPCERKAEVEEWATLDCYPSGAKTPARTGLE